MTHAHHQVTSTHTHIPVCFIQYYDLVPTFGKGHFLVSKHLDAVSHHFNASIIRGIQLQDGIFEGAAEECSGQTQNAGGLSRARRTLTS